MTGEAVPFGMADVTNCDREQIHIPGSIQPHGCLLALEPGDLRILHVGGDTLGLLGGDEPFQPRHPGRQGGSGLVEQAEGRREIGHCGRTSAEPTEGPTAQDQRLGIPRHSCKRAIKQRR